MSAQNQDQDMENISGEEEVPFKAYSMNVLPLVKSSQNQNGLRHGDYARYHHYCIRKMYRLRKPLKFMNQRGEKPGVKQEYLNKVVSFKEASKNERYLQILIFKCEADWAYAMNMKKALTNQEGINAQKEEAKAGLKNQSQFNQKDANSQRNTFRLKAHAKKRFKSVNRSCKQLLDVSNECLDGYSKYETEAYVNGMQASYLIEVENYQEALDLLMKSKVIYQKISEYKDSLEAVIYDERIGQLDTFIRLCCSNLSLQSSADKEASIKKAIGGQIQNAHEATVKEQIENIEEITYNGKTIPLKSDRLKLVFKRVESQLAELQDPSKQNNDQINNFLKFVNIIDDAQLVIKKEKAEESKKSEQTGQLYNVLILYTQQLKLKATMDRNLLQAKLLASKLNTQQLFASHHNVHHHAGLGVRPQNIVRFYEKALKAMKTQSSSSEGLDPLSVLQNEMTEKYTEALITYYIALHYIQEQSTVKAMVILQVCQYRIEEAIEFAQDNMSNLKGEKTQSMISDLSNNHLGKVNYALCKCHAKYLIQSQSKSTSAIQSVAPEQIRKDVQAVKFDNLYDLLCCSNSMKSADNLSKQVTIGKDKAILNFLDDPSNLKFDEKEGKQEDMDMSKMKISKQFKLINPLPKLQSVQATPQFFDMAGGYVVYPDMETQIKKYEVQGGLFSSITGFFGS